MQPNECLIVGFMGSWESWNSDQRPVRKLALRLQAMQLPGVHVETVENARRDLALELVRKVLDRNGDDVLDANERSSARVILYGHSFGGAAVLKFARQLKELGVPVLLTIQVDSVGRDDSIVPSNVAQAANFYQHSGLLIRGQPVIRSQDPEHTVILGNFRYDAHGQRISTADYPWPARLFARAHTRMASDPELWQDVEELILKEVGQKTAVGLGSREK